MHSPYFASINYVQKRAVGKFSDKDPKASSTHCCRLFCSLHLGEGQTQKPAQQPRKSQPRGARRVPYNNYSPDVPRIWVSILKLFNGGSPGLWPKKVTFCYTKKKKIVNVAFSIEGWNDASFSPSVNLPCVLFQNLLFVRIFIKSFWQKYFTVSGSHQSGG